MSSPGLPVSTPSPQGGGGAPSPAPGGGTGAATNPRPMMGAGVQALTLVHQGMKALQMALANLPMGSELHQAVLKAVTDISRRIGSAGGGGSGDHAAQIQGLVAQARDIQSNPQAALMQQALQRGGGGGAPGAAGGGQ